MGLSLKARRHAFFPDHTCTREGEVGDKLWIMNSGPVMLTKKGHRVKMYLPGTHFGCDNMLGLLGTTGFGLRAMLQWEGSTHKLDCM